jgi:hypothetical protein
MVRGEPVIKGAPSGLIYSADAPESKCLSNFSVIRTDVDRAFRRCLWLSFALRGHQPVIYAATQPLKMMTRPAIIPVGSWPRRMPAALAAGRCGEPSRPGLRSDGGLCEAIISETLASAVSNQSYNKMARPLSRKAP